MEHVITVKIKDVDSFYNPYVGDFSKNKSLNPDLEAYLQECLKAYTLEDIGKVRILLQADDCVAKQKIALETDLKKYFNKKYIDLQKNYEHLHRVRRKELFLGIFIILLCMFINNLLDSYVPSYPLTTPINTMIVIVGWVALWVPAVFFLYTRRDLKRKIAFMEEVTKLPVEYKKIEVRE